MSSRNSRPHESAIKWKALIWCEVSCNVCAVLMGMQQNEKPDNIRARAPLLLPTYPSCPSASLLPWYLTRYREHGFILQMFISPIVWTFKKPSLSFIPLGKSLMTPGLCYPSVFLTVFIIDSALTPRPTKGDISLIHLNFNFAPCIACVFYTCLETASFLKQAPCILIEC